MGSHSATKSHPQGPIRTAAPRASKWAPQNVMTVNGLTRRRFLPVVLAVGLGGLWGSLDHVFGAGSPVKVRLGTLAPRGSSYTKHLLAMGERWRQAPGGGVLLTVYPDGVMGSEADMVRRMRLGQLQAGMLTAAGLAEIEPAVSGLQNLPMMFRTLEEVGDVFSHIGQRFCFVGHTHLPVIVTMSKRTGKMEVVRDSRIKLRDGDRYFVNVGSIGQPPS